MMSLLPASRYLCAHRRRRVGHRRVGHHIAVPASPRRHRRVVIGIAASASPRRHRHRHRHRHRRFAAGSPRRASPRRNPRDFPQASRRRHRRRNRHGIRRSQHRPSDVFSLATFRRVPIGERRGGLDRVAGRRHKQVLGVRRRRPPAARPRKVSKKYISMGNKVYLRAEVSRSHTAPILAIWTVFVAITNTTDCSPYFAVGMACCGALM